MEFIVIATNILLTVLTTVYVILTYRLVNETKRATDQTRALFEKQFLLSTLPHLHINIDSEKTVTSVTIYNSGDIAAHDVDLLIVGNCAGEEMDIPTFMVNYVTPKHRRVKSKATDEGSWGTYDHLFYPIVPQRRRVVTKLLFPKLPIGIYCLLQFRELTGTNYSQVYWFSRSKREGSMRFYIGGIYPNIITPSPRIKSDFAKGRKLLAEGDEPLPKHVNDKFTFFWEHSIPSGYLHVEDRGEWHDI